MKRSISSCERGSRTGLTLIEVVAGLALMGTLLVAVLLGASSHLRQLRTARQKTSAIESLDRLLPFWSRDGFSQESLPECALLAKVHLFALDMSVASAEDPDAIGVRVQSRPLAESTGFRLEVVRLEAWASHDQLDGTPLTWVEVLRVPSASAIRSQ